MRNPQFLAQPPAITCPAQPSAAARKQRIAVLSRVVLAAYWEVVEKIGHDEAARIIATQGRNDDSARGSTKQMLELGQ